MQRISLIAMAVVLVVGGGLFFFVNPGEDRTEAFRLTDDGAGIVRRGEKEPFITSADLPDSVPPQFAHSSYQSFDNRRFHFISISPNEENIIFASGEGDQWLGMINAKEKYIKFLIFGIKTTFLDAVWSPDGQFVAFAFWGPDRRLLTYIISPPAQLDPKPGMLNVWFRLFEQQPQYKAIGWQENGDTSFSFAILDLQGKELERVKLGLRFDRNKIPERMKKEVGQ